MEELAFFSRESGLAKGALLGYRETGGKAAAFRSPRLQGSGQATPESRAAEAPLFASSRTLIRSHYPTRAGTDSENHAGGRNPRES